jgi:pilus assembly protein FimV
MPLSPATEELCRASRSKIGATTLLALLGWLSLLGLGSLTSFDAHALTLGRLNVLSSMGEPLRAEVDIMDLTAAEASSFQPSLATAEAYKAMGLDYNPDLNSMQFNLQRSPDGRAVLQLSNSKPVTAAFVDIVLEVSWAAGKITRDFTLLLTPPKTAESITPVTPVLPMTELTARPAPVASVTKRVTVIRGDTAGQLALQSLPVNVSLDQMLLALLRTSPDAFVAGNVNRLKAGAVLVMPTAADASTTPPDEARQIIVAQSRDFNAFRQQLASNARPAQVIASGREASGKVQSKVEEKTAAAAATDKLTLSKGALKGTTPGTGNAEEKFSQERQAKEATDRLAELSKNISDLNKLGVAPAALTASEPVTANSADPALAIGTPPAVTAAAQADAEQTGLIARLSENPIVLPAAAGFLGLLLAWGFFRSRRNSADKNEGGGSALHSVDSALEEHAESIELSIDRDSPENAKPAAPAARQEPLEDDSLTLAQGELALGREVEAEALLRSALKRTPQRLALHLELMDIYIDRDDAPSFESLAIQALTITGGQGANWERICKKGQALDPTNPLYQSAATSPTPTPPFDKLDFDLELGTNAPGKVPPRAKS